LAAGKPVIFNVKTGYCKYKKFGCGISDDMTPGEFASLIDAYCDLPEKEYMQQCLNARKVAEEHDFKRLTERLIGIIEDKVENEEK
jgi:hypothetical protein